MYTFRSSGATAVWLAMAAVAAVIGIALLATGETFVGGIILLGALVRAGLALALRGRGQQGQAFVVQPMQGYGQQPYNQVPVQPYQPYPQNGFGAPMAPPPPPVAGPIYGVQAPPPPPSFPQA